MEVTNSGHCGISVPPDTTDGVTRDVDVWLADGNCVVVANNFAFRVYKGILSLHSDLFRDLFSLPNSSNSDMMDGCPIVTVTDDPHDIRCLFLVLCCGKDFYHENDEPKPVQFAVLASLIRMGHKYTIPKIMNDALSRLKKYYPISFSAWDDVATREGYVTTEPIDAFEVVRLARLTETPSLLPSAFFTCCENMCSISTEGDGHPAEGQLLLQGLSVDDSRRLINGRENLALGVVNRLLKLITKHANLPSDYRTSHRTCVDRVASIFNLRTLDGSFFKTTRYHAALQPLSDWFFANPTTDPTGRPGLQCENCLKFLKLSDEKSRTAVWGLLPEVFNLHVIGWPSSTE
ncbi:hypothetical protein LXA43DRAFT_1028036 [Ganoderma leucocontextum]|nr:hypothetical protein LXA43DRAFT_1028036 [Ganoderma leucocontextum]